MTEITVVVPTHNRAAMLGALLERLGRQRPGTPPFEVLVVADGCVDGTAAMLAGLRPSFPLRSLALPGVGPALGRNHGAEAAKGPLLIFLDDDIVPGDGFVLAHAAEHARHPGCVVLGPYPPLPHAARSWFRLRARAWWTGHFERVAQPGHRFSYTDVLTGNLSMTAELFGALGGLDPQFARAREDYEFGLRLLARGIPIRYAPDALGHHMEHETTTLVRAMARRRQEGRSDMLMAHKHPDIAGRLEIARFLGKRGRKKRWTRALAVRAGPALDPLAALAPPVLRLLEWIGLRKAYARLERTVRLYQYLRGAAEAADGDWRRPPAPAVAADPSGEPATIDLAEGIAAAEAALAARRPHAVRIVHGGVEVGELPFEAGAEPWDGRHLRPWLQGPGAARYLPLALAARQADGRLAPPPLRAASLVWLNDPSFGGHMNEQYRQWADAQLSASRSVPKSEVLVSQAEATA